MGKCLCSVSNSLRVAVGGLSPAPPPTPTPPCRSRLERRCVAGDHLVYHLVLQIIIKVGFIYFLSLVRLLILEREEGGAERERERERERDQCERETLIGCLLYAP